jgi:flagellar protein FlgJ
MKVVPNSSVKNLSSSQKALREAAQEFESLFIQQLFKEMRKSVSDSDLFGDRDAEKTFQSMLDEEMSIKLSKGGGIGLSDVIYKQLVNFVAKDD